MNDRTFFFVGPPCAATPKISFLDECSLYNHQIKKSGPPLILKAKCNGDIASCLLSEFIICWLFCFSVRLFCLEFVGYSIITLSISNTETHINQNGKFV